MHLCLPFYAKLYNTDAVYEDCNSSLLNETCIVAAVFHRQAYYKMQGGYKETVGHSGLYLGL